MKNVGKRNGVDEQQDGLERERFEPYQQHPDLNAILNRFAESAFHSNDRSFYNVQAPDYFFDETNAIDTKQRLPTRLQSIRTTASRPGNDVDIQADPFNVNPDDSAQSWYEEKQHSLLQQQQQQRQQQKQQPLNGHKSHYLHQWNQQINEKTDPAQQQQQKQQPLKSFDNNGDFMQSLDLN